MANSARLPIPTRGLLRVKHGVRIGRAVLQYGSAQQFWWLVPVVGILALAALALSITSAALPVTVYTLF